MAGGYYDSDIAYIYGQLSKIKKRIEDLERQRNRKFVVLDQLVDLRKILDNLEEEVSNL